MDIKPDNLLIYVLEDINIKDPKDDDYKTAIKIVAKICDMGVS